MLSYTSILDVLGVLYAATFMVFCKLEILRGILFLSMFLFSTCLEAKYLSYHRQVSGGVGTVRAENIAKGRKTNSIEKTEMHCTQEYG
jgi:hypothetical protein